MYPHNFCRCLLTVLCALQAISRMDHLSTQDIDGIRKKRMKELKERADKEVVSVFASCSAS